MEKKVIGFILVPITLFVLLLPVVLAKVVANKVGVSNPAGLVRDFVATSQNKIKSDQGRVNILILGKAGGNYAGADLTDTMILVSISLIKPSVVFISIPRDIWISEIRAKINSAYYYGGVDLSRSLAEEVLGVDVQYSLVVDFSGFEKVINALGGIDVYVENSFSDSKYPIAGRENDMCGGDPEYKCRYETLTFESGWQHMNGKTALKFVRSRNASGAEGTDIAREARQQKVITAIKNKVLSPQTLLHPGTLIQAWNISKEFIQTDILEASAWAVIARRVFEARNSISSNLVPEDLLYHPPESKKYDYQYVFVPVGGSWDNLHRWVSTILEQ